MTTHDLIEKQAMLIRELRADLRQLAEVVLDLEFLIDHSMGVDGLHLNGDIAVWSELCSGGRFETWLGDVESACQTARQYVSKEVEWCAIVDQK